MMDMATANEKAIFAARSRHALRNLEFLYLDLSCEYHLVQDERCPHERPFIPALTQRGLHTWLLALAKAYPDTEAERIDSVLARRPAEIYVDSAMPARRLLADLPAFPAVGDAVRGWQKRMGDKSHAVQVQERGGRNKRYHEGSKFSTSPSRSESYRFFQRGLGAYDELRQRSA